MDIYVDGSFNSVGSGARLFPEDSHREACSYTLRFDFPTTNNKTEYETLIARLQLASKLGAQQIQVNSDTQLVVCQVVGEYKAKEEIMQ